MRLKELLEGMVLLPKSGLGAIGDVLITGLALDSRKVVEGDLFIALSGANQHGLIHVVEAIDMGACAVIFDPSGSSKQLEELGDKVPMIAVADLGLKLGDIAARYYGNPSGLSLIHI